MPLGVHLDHHNRFDSKLGEAGRSLGARLTAKIGNGTENRESEVERAELCAITHRHTLYAANNKRTRGGQKSANFGISQVEILQNKPMAKCDSSWAPFFWLFTDCVTLFVFPSRASAPGAH